MQPFGCQSEEMMVIQELLLFCHQNGWKYLTLHQEKPWKNGIIYFKEANKFQLRFNIAQNQTMIENDLKGTLISFHAENIEDFLSRNVILALNDSDFNDLSEKLNDFNENLHFFVLNVQTMKWKQILRIKNNKQIIIDDFKPQEQKVGASIDLQGLELDATAMSWAPYITVETESFGFLVDLMQIWSQELNFTWKTIENPNQDWGLQPKNGSYDLSGDWSGAFGDVVSGKFPMSLSVYFWLFERRDLLDFVPIVKETTVLSALPKNPDIDLSLFIRPFRSDAWEGILLIAFVCLLVWIMTRKIYDCYGTKLGILTFLPNYNMFDLLLLTLGLVLIIFFQWH